MPESERRLRRIAALVLVEVCALLTGGVAGALLWSGRLGLDNVAALLIVALVLIPALVLPVLPNGDIL